jgi:hypothetical protein
MTSVVLSAKAPHLRRYSYSSDQPPPLPPRRNSLVVPHLKLQAVPLPLSGGMDSRHYRPASPRSRVVNPARSSTGTFADPYYDPSFYRSNVSPRSSGDKIASSSQLPYAYPPSSSASRTASRKYDAYSGRPRRNTLNESDDRLIRPNARDVAPALPIRPAALHQHHNHDRPSSPLARTADTRGETYITHAPRSQHKRIYSVDDNSHKAKLVAEREIVEPPRRDRADARGYSVTSGDRTYPQPKLPSRPAELGDDGYSYTDPASMYRDTEPAWRRPRSGSVEHGARPTSMIMDRGPRTSNLELGPPPSTRGFDKINSGIGRSGSVRDPRPRSSSIERARDAPRYDPYPEAAPTRASSTRHAAPAVHQEPHRRDVYYDSHERRDRELENRRQIAPERFEDRDVVTRGFGIAPGPPALAIDHHALDRQPIWHAQETPRARPESYSAPYYPSDRADVRMSEPRVSRERDLASGYEDRPREQPKVNMPIVAAGAATGAAATFAAAKALSKSRDKDLDRDRDRDRDSDRDSDKERDRERESRRERERRREWDERDRRDRVPEERREARPVEDLRNRAPVEERVAPAAVAYASAQDPPERRALERGHEGEDMERKLRDRQNGTNERERERKVRVALSDDDSDAERPRHYVKREAAQDMERQKESSSPSAALDPDEEYRRRIQQEAERSGRVAREHDTSDSDRERERRRHKDERDRSRTREPAGSPGSRVSPSIDPVYPLERSRAVFDSNMVQEPDSLALAPMDHEQRGKSVTIVDPPKEERSAAPRGILRKPTTKFPEDPDPIREGVAPHKSALKGKDIPVDARWTKIDRRLVNPGALEEAKERFEERMDCVIVLRVLTKQEIQKLADRTREIRETRGKHVDLRHRCHIDIATEDDYEHHDRRDGDGEEDRDPDRVRDMDRTRDRDGDRDRDQEREKDRDKDHGREKDRDRSRDRERRSHRHRDDEDRDKAYREYDGSDDDEEHRRQDRERRGERERERVRVEDRR